MRRLLLGLVAVALLAGCASRIAEFWRPISEPNILLAPEKGQAKLNFDLSQCRCGIYPSNVPQGDLVAFQPDKQRLAETSVTITQTPQSDGCMQRPSLVVAQCMRERGWEVTTCSGRMPVPGGGALCAETKLDDK